MKRFVLTLVLLVLALALAIPVSAEEELERPLWPDAMESVQEGQNLVDAVGDAAVGSYLLSQKTARRMSFQGWCGLMTSHQLYNLGINKNLIVNDGNGQFDYYSSREMTTGGYYINAYSANEYTLEEALNTLTDYGNKDVFNVLVGFEWTHTEAGGIYGHAVVINGIIDGYVYFVESYDCTFGRQGALLTCTIQEFAKYYKPWTLFEGIIHFGDGVFSNVCPTISTDLMVQTRFSTVLRSQPSMLGKKGAERIRDVAAGEVFRAIALCRDTRGDYYKVLTNEGEAFISVNAVSLLRAGNGEMVLTDLQLPELSQPGESFPVGGTVTATHGRVASLEISIFATDGTPVRKESIEVDNRSGELSPLGEQLCSDLLEPGVYVAEVYAYCIAPVASNTWGQSRYQRVRLHRQYLVIGTKQESLPPLEQTGTEAKQVLPDGWLDRQGIRYHVRDGQYLTGWQVIDGKRYYFSATGALCKGWLTLDGISWYLREDGSAAVGRQEISGVIWSFDDSGRLLGREKS